MPDEDKPKKQSAQSKYYHKNKKRLTERIACECGCMISRRSMHLHIRTQKHDRFIKFGTRYE